MVKPSSLKSQKEYCPFFNNNRDCLSAFLLHCGIELGTWYPAREVKQNTERETTVQAPVQSSPSSMHSSSASDDSEDGSLSW